MPCEVELLWVPVFDSFSSCRVVRVAVVDFSLPYFGSGFRRRPPRVRVVVVVAFTFLISALEAAIALSWPTLRLLTELNEPVWKTSC